ncbi:MAG: hypothetical protein ACLFTR_01950 [Candidatus Woesearchaeota archaeon]
MECSTIDLETTITRTASEEENATEKVRFSKHDHFVNILKEEIESLYDHVMLNYTFFSRSRKSKRVMVKGEADIIAIKGNVIDAYEVKCSYRMTKAKQQLKKIKRQLERDFSGFKINTYFYCGDSEILKMIRS